MKATVRLFGQQLRRDRLRLPLWIAAIGLVIAASSAAIASEFAQEQDRLGLIALAAANPALLFLRGVPDGTSVAGLVFFQAFSFVAVIAALMTTFLVVRHTRGDEDAGRSELVGSTPVSRVAPLVATVLLALAANVVLVLAVAVGFLVGGAEGEEALLAALAVGSVGWVFTGVAALAAQLLPSARAANGVSAALVGLAYVLRGVGDALGAPADDLTAVTSAWPSWLSPIGWGQRIAPFSEQDARPLLLAATVGAVLVLTAAALRARRDLGASLVPERSGSARAGWGLSTLPGLAWRLHAPSLVGWLLAAAVIGAVAGGLAPTVADALAANPAIADLVARLAPGVDADMVDLFATAILGLAGAVAACAGLQSVLRVRSEEADGHAEALLATPVRRARWLASHLLLAVGSIVAVCLGAGVAAGIGFQVAAPEGLSVGSSVVAALAHAPAALVLVGITAAAVAVAPRIAVGLSWSALVIAVLVGQFGDLLRLPDWVRRLSPFAHSPALPAEDLDWLPLLTMTAIAAVLTIIAAAALRRRDMPR